ncbi:MAG: gliding motility protein GldN, partial [Saprospiraceae bacterium]|nr:gliding motility protein GldN [Saprospiraceae bacterium]
PLAEDPIFWIYYPDFREKLARFETFNPLNDALRMSWDDLFKSRFFSSYIVKASNALDQDIIDYTGDQMDALYESEAIKEQIFNFEHDLWEF